MKLAVAIMFMVACYAGDCLAASPNVVSDQSSYNSVAVKRHKGKIKGKKKRRKAAKASGQHAG